MQPLGERVDDARVELNLVLRVLCRRPHSMLHDVAVQCVLCGDNTITTVDPVNASFLVDKTLEKVTQRENNLHATE